MALGDDRDSPHVRLEDRPREPWRGDAADAGPFLGRRQVADVEGPERRNLALFREAEAAAGPEAGSFQVVVAMTTRPAAEFMRVEREIRLAPVG